MSTAKPGTFNPIVIKGDFRPKDPGPPPQGWQCPVCKSVWAPEMVRCYDCSPPPNFEF